MDLRSSCGAPIGIGEAYLKITMLSFFLVLYEGDTRNRWRDGPVCPAVDKELWRLGQTVRGVFLACYAPIGRGVKRDFVDLRIRRSEGRVVNTPLLLFKGLFFEGHEEKDRKKPGERVVREEAGEREKEKDRRKKSKIPRESEKDDERRWR
ncbi:hypothetical protein TNCV_3980431 [Trichonephila clavipes]|nr:hypothetical protein TNCV_3980431 [Trichonephila clavipes]